MSTRSWQRAIDRPCRARRRHMLREGDMGWGLLREVEPLTWEDREWVGNHLRLAGEYGRTIWTGRTA